VSWSSLEVVKDGHAYAVDMDAWFLNASLVAAEYVLDDLEAQDRQLSPAADR
jgi:iron complex transport system substrate-binding protein